MTMIKNHMLQYFVMLFALGFLFGNVLAYDNGQVPVNTPESARRMIEDLIATFGDQYPQGKEYLQRLDAAVKKMQQDPQNPEGKQLFQTLLREAALANPLLDFDRLLLVRRNTQKGWGFVGLNAYTNDTVPRHGWDNELVVLSDLRGEPKWESIHRQPNEAVIRDLDLHFDGRRIMFSSINEQGRWAIYEVGTDGKGLRELSPPAQEDVDWFDSCYLPEAGYMICASTAGMQGLPCENGGRVMVNLYRIAIGKTHSDGTFEPPPEKRRVRQLTFEQDSDWHPTVDHDGRVMYLRWEYSDIPHYMSRILFTMQPDGRQQRAIWGSGSYFPTAFKSPRVVPDHNSLIMGVVSGHHTAMTGLPESGRLLLLDPQLGSKYPFRYDPVSKEWAPETTHLNIYPRVYPKEVTGCVQEIPGYGREVVGNVYDNQGGIAKYQFAYPWPLNENYYLVSMRDTQRGGMFGLYLVDRFDNMTKIIDSDTDSFFQPIPLSERPTPPVRMDLTDPDNKESSLFISDVYHGLGLPDVPRGTIKSLRIFAYHFGYRGSGGHESVGMVSSWDIKRILGTVSVEEDGSASFKVPSNTPISIQALDAEGRAVQLMRSWTVCMPGEQQACVGCHEPPQDVTPNRHVIAATRRPQDITPWYGPARSFGYEAEIQPMLEKHCVACHNDENGKQRGLLSFEAHETGQWHTDTSYAALNPFTWRPGPESDLDILPPMDYHASVSELVQRLEKGHYGVELDHESWDRIHTWIDLNVPYRGQWSNPHFEKRRLELAEIYADGLETNPEEEYRSALASREKSEVRKLSPAELDEVIKKYAVSDSLELTNWPFDAQTAKKMQCGDRNVKPMLQVELGKSPEPLLKPIPQPQSAPRWPTNGPQSMAPPLEAVSIDLGENRHIDFVRIPAGRFIMGQQDGLPDEQKRRIVNIDKPFWIAETEITNGQFGMFDPDHDTRYLREDGKDHIVPGYIANHPNQPVARVSFDQAEEFCRWLSEKSGQTVRLPSESEWEWAARAGTETPFWYGDRDTDYSQYANLSGAEVRWTYTTWESGSTLHLRRPYPKNSLFPLRDDRFKDKWFVVDYVRQYDPNPWGLYDMIGNVWEWTRPDPANTPEGKVVARGGSWKDRPKVTGASARVVYEPWQKVMNVGFRPILMEEYRPR